MKSHGSENKPKVGNSEIRKDVLLDFVNERPTFSSPEYRTQTLNSTLTIFLEHTYTGW